jgi:hypothetical protein
MLPSRENLLKQLRISQGNILATKELITRTLPAELSLTIGQQYGDYTRLIFTHTGNPTEKLVLDVRLGPMTALNTPSIAIRGDAPIDSASETLIGAKVTPVKTPNSITYQTEHSVKSLVDIVSGSFYAKELEKNNEIRGTKTIEQHFRALLAPSPGREYAKVMDKNLIPTGTQQFWSVPSPGEQIQAAYMLPISLRDGPHFSEEVNRIINQIESGEAATGLGSLKGRGTWNVKRTPSGGFVLIKTGNVEVTKTSEGLEYTSAVRLRGVKDSTVESLMKTDKMRSVVNRSRSPEVMPLQYSTTGALTPMTVETMKDIGVVQTGAHKLESRVPTYVKSGIIYTGEENERNVRPALVLLTAMPTHEGGMMIAPKMTKNIVGFGMYGGEKIDLPKLTGTDLSSEIPGNNVSELFSTRNLNDAVSKAGSRTALSLGKLKLKSGDELALKLKRKEYDQQTNGGVLVIPPYMDKEGNWYDDDSNPNAFSTDSLKTTLTAKLASKGIRVENSGKDQVYLYVNTIDITSAASKGEGFKGGDTPVGGPRPLQVEILSGKVKNRINLDAVTKEMKVMPFAMASNFGLNSFEAKQEILGYIDPRLRDWFSRNYSEGQAVDEEFLAAEYHKLLKTGHADANFMWRDMAEKMLATARVDTDTNMKFIKRYGIGVADEGEVYGGRVTQAWIDMQKVIAAEQGTTLDKIGIKLARVKGSNDLYEMKYKVAKGSPIIMAALGTSAEYPGQSKEVNADIAAAIATNFPSFAEARGLLPEQQLEKTHLKERAAWQNVTKAYSLNLASMQGDVRQVEGAMVVDEKFAELLLTKDIFKTKLGGKTEEQAIKELAEALGDAPIFFKTSGRYLMSPKDIMGIDLFDQAKNKGESVSHYATQYINSLKELLLAEREGKIDPGRVRAHTQFMSGPESRIGETIGSGREILRHIFGAEVKGAVSGHYRVLNALNPGEVYLGPAELERIGRSMGLRSNYELQELRKYIETGKASGTFWRYPTLSEEHGVAPVTFIGQKELEKRMGEEMWKYNAFDPGTIYINPFTPEWFIGDEDVDPGGLMIGLTPKWGKGKNGRKKLIGFEDELAKDPEYAARIKEYKDLLKDVVGKDGVSVYSTMRKAVKEYIEGKTPEAQLRDMGSVEYKKTTEAFLTYRRIMARRGTSHMSMTAFKLAAQALGVPKEMLTEASRGLAILYQQTLETTMEASRSSPIETLMKSVRLTAPVVEKSNDYEQWAGRGMAMIGASSEVIGSDMPAFSELWTSGGSAGTRGMIREIAYGVSKMREFSDEALAMGLADITKFEESRSMILDALRNDKDRLRVLSKMIDKGVVSTNSMFGLQVMSATLSRTFKKAHEGTTSGDEALRTMLETERSLAWKGKMYTAREMTELPEFARFRRAYALVTGKGLLPGESRFPGANELEELSNSDSVPYGISRQIKAFLDWTGFSKAKKEEGRTTGGIRREDIEEFERYGPKSMLSPSMISPIYLQNKYAQEQGITTTARMLGALLGKPELASMEFPHDEATMKLFELGNKYEKLVATANPNLTLIPRKMGEERMHWSVGKRELTGLPDFIGIVDGPDGPELILREVKYGKSSSRSGAIQSALYAEGLKKMYQDNPDELRRIMGTWRTSAKTLYSKELLLGGNEPSIAGDDFIDKAMSAIENKRIRTQIGVGSFTNKDLVEKTPVGSKAKGLEHVVTELEKTDPAMMEQIVEEAALRLGSGLRKNLSDLNVLLEYGSVQLDNLKKLSGRINPTLKTATVSALEMLKQTVHHAKQSKFGARGWHNIRIRQGESLRNSGVGEMVMNIKLQPGQYAKFSDSMDELNKQAIHDTKQPEFSEQNVNRASLESIIANEGLDEEDSMAANLAGSNVNLETTTTPAGGRGSSGGGGGSGDQGNPRYMNTPKIPPDRRGAALAALTSYQQLQQMLPEVEAAYQAVGMTMRGGFGESIPEVSSIKSAQEMITATTAAGGRKPLARSIQAHPIIAQAKGVYDKMRTAMGAAGLLQGNISGNILRSDEEETQIRELMKSMGVGLQPGEQQGEGALENLGETLQQTDAARRGGPKLSKAQSEAVRSAREFGISQVQPSTLMRQESLNENIKELSKAMHENTKASQHNTPAIGKLSQAIDQLEKSDREFAKADIAKAELTKMRTEIRARGPTATATADELVAMKGLASDQQVHMGRGERALTRAELLEQEAETAGKKPGKAERIGMGLRSIFGGFGMMYMQRVMGYGIESMTQGEREYAQYRDTQQELMARSFGTAPYSTQQTRRQSALVRAGGGISSAISDVGNLFLGTPAGDTLAQLKTGAGVGLAGLFGAAELSLPMAATLPFIGGAAIAGIGLTAAAQQYGYATNPNQAYMKAYAGQYQPGKASQPGQYTSKESWYQAGGIMKERAESYGGGIKGFALGMMESFMNDVKAGETKTGKEYDRQKQLGESYLNGTLTNVKQEDIPLIINYIATNKEKTKFSGFDDQTISSAVVSTLGGGNLSSEIAVRKAQQIYAGVPVDQIKKLAYATTGGTPSLAAETQIERMIPTEPIAAQAQAMGMETYAQMSLAYQKRAYPGGEPMAYSYALRMAPQAAGWQKQPWYQTFQMQNKQVESAELTGINVPTVATPEQMNAMSLQQQQAMYYQTMVQERQRQQADSWAMQGYKQRSVVSMTGLETSLLNQYGMTGVTAMNRAQGLQQQLMGFGVGESSAVAAMNQYAPQLAQGNMAGYSALMSMMNGSPQGMAIYQQQKLGLTGTQLGAGLTVGGTRVPIDVTSQGRVTGYAPFTTNMSAADVTRVLGPNAANAGVLSSELGKGYLSKYAPEGAEPLYGLRALSVKTSDYMHEVMTFYQNQQQKQLGMQRQYWLGGGNYGRGLWAIQDDQRNLGYQQQEWGFAQQERQASLQREQFYAGRGLQQRGTEMQRGFTQADWSYQDTMRGMQWQWKQEDFQEQARFMTGRQRKLAERGMQRETITYNLEGERISTQRDQQKQLWNLEDERFELERTNFEENAKMAKEQLEKQKEFYEQNKKLQEEELGITRKYQLDQLDLQQQQLDAQSKFNEELQKTKTEQDYLQFASQDMMDNWKMTVEFSNLLADTIRGIFGTSGNPASTGSVSSSGAAGAAAVVGPGGQVNTNPWSNTVLGQSGYNKNETVTINVQIGNETIGKYILDQLEGELTVSTTKGR